MDYMKQALSLAKLALGQVSPNPAVGAVVVKDGEVVGQGYTQPPGSWHAEVMALKQAGEKAQGGVMYVTLEPCCQYGRTPPCTQAIIDAGISEVHLAMLDPNPLVSARGEAELEREDIKTYVGEHNDEAKEINEAYIKFITTGMPFVTVKFAVSLDGKIATKSSDSKWISGEEARKHVHYLRYITDAIMTGANTIIADDPHLTCRYAGKGGEVRKQPLRVIVDGRGHTPSTAQVFSERGKALMALGRFVEPEKKEALAQVGAELLELPSEEGLVDLERLLKVLGERDITSVLVEGGGILLGSLFDCGLVDKVIAFIAPIIIGGIVYIHKEDGTVLPLVEPYITEEARTPFKGEIIPENEYFVLGDNRINSGDSRYGWTVPRQSIIGKAWLSIWPPNKWGLAANYPLQE